MGRVAQLRPAGGPGLYESAQGEGLSWKAPYTFVVAPETGGRLAKYQNIGTEVLEARELDELEEGKTYVFSAHDTPWRVTDLEASLARVSYTKVTHPGTDDEEREQIEARRDFWFNPERPFSPLQTLPLQLENSLFVNYEYDRIQEALFGRLEDGMQEAGMLVRMQMSVREEPRVYEIQSIGPARELDLAVLDEVMIVPESQADAIAGPMFLSEMIQDAMDEQGAARLAFVRDNTRRPLEAEGSAGFKLMPNGDFAVATVFDDGETRGMLLLLRPYHGLPEPGSHPTAPQRGTDELKKLSAEDLKEYAKGFQAMGVLQQGKQFTVLTEATGGSVAVDQAGEEAVTGTLDLHMKGLKGGRLHDYHVSARFEAPQGMPGQFRHPVGTLIERAAD